MTALVTGVAGFVGSAIARQLVNSGTRVVGIDSFTDYYDPRIKRARAKELVRQGVEVVEADLNTLDLDHIVPGMEYIFHQAGQPGVRKSWGADFTIYTRDNIDATQRLLDVAVRSKELKRLVYASSSSIYGDAESYPTAESVRPQPRSPYGVTKLAAEHLVSLYASNMGLPAVSLRYFTVYGPGQRPDMAFDRFIRSALSGTPIDLYGDGEQVRDFTYITDVVAANLLASCTGGVVGGSIYNVAGGGSISVNDVLRKLERILDREILVNRLPPALGDVRRTGGETLKIREELGWIPSVELDEGLASQIETVRLAMIGESN